MTVRQHRLSDPPYPSDYIYPADKDYPLNEDWEGGPIALLDTSEGLNNQAWHLEYNATGTVPYNPDMMQYDGTTGYYSKTYPSTGNKVSAVLRFNRTAFTGDDVEWLLYASPTGGNRRLSIVVFSSDYTGIADHESKVRITVQDSVGGILWRVISNVVVCDGTNKTLFVQFDGDVGTAGFIINGTNADDTGHASRTAPIAGTLGTSASSEMRFGVVIATSAWFGGEIGFCGHADTAGLTWSDFMEANGSPKQLDEITWIEWGGQPLFWKDTGDQELNLGSEGAMTKNGTITQVPADPVPGDVQGFKVTPEDTGDPVNVLSGVNSVQCGLAFDQNAHVTIVWVDQFDVGHLYWYDTTVGNWIITDFENPVAGVGLTLDDKRNEQTGASDILLWYTLAVDGHHEIYTREQRDRFATPYPMQPGLPVWPYFKKLGMADELRVQMTMTNVGPV